MTLPIVAYLQQLEALRQRRVLLYITEDRSPAKLIDDPDIDIFYHCLQTLGGTDRLDLVLHTMGGKVSVSHRIHKLLRSYAHHIDVLVPRKARSSGTLLCLGANNVVMTPVAELSPLDPHIASGDAASAMPSSISAEDIRTLREMAETWFGLQSEASRVEVFRVLGERVFPTTLSSFFRADQQMRQIANELLQCQLPDQSQLCEQIIERLITGYYAHDTKISLSEAQDAGLRATAATAEEEQLLIRLWQACHDYFNSLIVDEETGGFIRVNGLIASTDFVAKHVLTLAQMTSDDGATGPMASLMGGHWEIIN